MNLLEWLTWEKRNWLLAQIVPFLTCTYIRIPNSESLLSLQFIQCSKAISQEQTNISFLHFHISSSYWYTNKVKYRANNRVVLELEWNRIIITATLLQYRNIVDAHQTCLKSINNLCELVRSTLNAKEKYQMYWNSIKPDKISIFFELLSINLLH